MEEYNVEEIECEECNGLGWQIDEIDNIAHQCKICFGTGNVTIENGELITDYNNEDESGLDAYMV